MLAHALQHCWLAIINWPALRVDHGRRSSARYGRRTEARHQAATQALGGNFAGRVQVSFQRQKIWLPQALPGELAIGGRRCQPIGLKRFYGGE